MPGRSDAAVAAHHCADMFFWHSCGTPTGSTSHQNFSEAEAVAQVVRGILSAGELTPGQVGVVTPYAGQVRLVRRVLNVPRGRAAAEAPGGVLEVASVDGFQAR